MSHTLFLFFPHDPFLSALEVVIPQKVQDAMDDIEGCLRVRIGLPLLRVVDRGLRADKDFAESFFIDGEGDAVGWGGVVEELFMEVGDMALRYKIDRDLLAIDFLMSEHRPH